MVREIDSGDMARAEPRWTEIQSALERVAELAGANISSHDFHAALIQQAASALSALAGAVWLRAADGMLERAAAWNIDVTGLQRSPAVGAAHLQLVDSVCARGEASLWPPGRPYEQGPDVGDTPDKAAPCSNPTEFVLVFSPIKLGAESIGAIELFHPEGSGPAAQREDLPLLAALAELAADFQRQQRLRDYAARERQWRGLEQFIQTAHASLDLSATAQAIVNEGRRLIGCDRLSLARTGPGKCRLLAVSGAEEVERRSNLVRRLEQLGARVLVYGESLWYPGVREMLAPDVEQALDAYLDQSHARVLGAVPLVKIAIGGGPGERPEPIGLLLIEQFHAAAVEPGLAGRAEAVARHAAAALANATDYDSLPLLKLEHGLQGVRWLTKARQLPKTLSALLLVLAAGLVLALVPANFEIEARGELQPRTRRDIFAPSDAIVSDIQVAERRDVRAGDVLVTLRRPQLDFELHRVLGETQTARKRLAGVQAARLGPERGKTDTTERYNQLTAEEEELKELLASLAEQELILREQQKELILTSPIDGQVLTWDVQQLLASRPVQRGQVLLAVGDLAGPWQLELRLPDDHAGYVLEAEQVADKPLEVFFLLATDPGRTYRGYVKKTALAAQTDDVYGPHVLVTVAIDRDEINGLRPGASVIGKIHCGRRALGFVWFHDLISIVRRRLLF